MTPNFSIEEFTATSHRNIDNTLPQGLYENARKTFEMLERIRAYLSILAKKEIPINISSGYRCLQLNRAIGSKDSSDHINALSVDWSARRFGTPYQVCMALKSQVDNLDIGQLIHEYGRWIHTSSVLPAKSINRIITITKTNTHVGIQEVK